MRVKVRHPQVKLWLASKGNAFPGGLSEADVPQVVTGVYEARLCILQAEFCGLPEGRWLAVRCFWGVRFCCSALLTCTPGEERVPGHNWLLTRFFFWEVPHGYNF